MSIRVLIADDHHAVRAGITAMLVGTEFEVAAQAVNCDQAVRYTLTCDPDVVLMDLRMPDGDGIKAVEQIKAKRPNTRVLLFTAAESVPTMLRAYQVGADGYVTKGVGGDELLGAMRRVAQGQRGWNRRQLRQIGTAKRRTYCFADGDCSVGLTERELQVLSRIVQGLTNEEIADALGIDLETVKQHVKALLGKLGVGDRTQAALWAMRYGRELHA